jgi:hypothetical protein
MQLFRLHNRRTTGLDFSPRIDRVISKRASRAFAAFYAAVPFL